MPSNPPPPPATPPSASRPTPQAVLETVRDLAAELHPQSPRVRLLGEHDSLERDFGLDSLARVELAARLERRFRVSLPEAAFAQPETPVALFEVIRHATAQPAQTHHTVSARAVPTEPGAARSAGPSDEAERDAWARAQAARAAATLALARPLRAEAELPADIGTLVAALEWHAATHPDRVTLLMHVPGQALAPVSYGALRRDALGVAHGLVNTCRAQPGERVAIMLPTGTDFFAAFYGALYAGAVPVPIYPPTRASQLEDHLRRIAGILANAGAAILVTMPEARTMAALLRPLAPSLRQITSAAALHDQPALYPIPRCHPGDTAFLQYTSGSTGQPKGVVLTHANLMANLRAMRSGSAVSSADLFVSWLPLYHDMGLIGAGLGSMVFGFKLVLTSPYTFLSQPVRWLQLLALHHATISAGPNFAYALCLSKINDEALRGLDLSSVRLLFNGAEAVSPDTVERFSARFARFGLRRSAMTPVYGLAECSLGVTFPPLARGPRIDTIDRTALQAGGLALPARQDDLTPIRLVSSGRALPGHEVRIVAVQADTPHDDARDASGDAAPQDAVPGEAAPGDAAPRYAVARYAAARAAARVGMPLPERMQGEIEFRGPSASAGYLGNPAATGQLLHDGWRRTGDLGYLANGELFVTGRIKDIIIRGGHNIHPQELEEAATRVAGVRKGGVAVFAARDPALGTERLIVLAETLVQDPAERERIVIDISHLAVDLLGLPADEVVLAPPHAILKTSSGKIRRAACRKRFERGEITEVIRPPWQQLLRLAGEGVALRLKRALSRLQTVAWRTRVVVSAILLAPPLIAVLLLGALRTRPATPVQRRLAATGTRWLFKAWGSPISLEGDAARIAEGHCLVVTNHASYLDGLVLTAALPPVIAFVAKQELASQWIAGQLLRSLGAVFVERFDARRSAQDAQRITTALARHERLVVFAEGTFHDDPGLLPLHLGAFLSAVRLGVPIMPVAILGTRQMLPGNAWVPRPARLRVIVGEPLGLPQPGHPPRAGTSLAEVVTLAGPAPATHAAHRIGEDWTAAIALRAQVRTWLLAQTGEPDLET